jgi:hypothetical protein
MRQYSRRRTPNKLKIDDDVDLNIFLSSLSPPPTAATSNFHLASDRLNNDDKNQNYG